MSRCILSAGGKYFSVNFSARRTAHADDCDASKAQILPNLYEEFRPKYQGKMEAALHGMTDKGKYSLMLLGAAGNGTGWHIDWTEAENMGFLLSGSPKPQKVRNQLTKSRRLPADGLEPAAIALWIFVIIGKEPVVESWLLSIFSLPHVFQLDSL